MEILCFTGYFFSLKFAVKFIVNCFVKFVLQKQLSSASITSSHVIFESSITLAKYLPFSQLHVAGFRM